ncbi:histidine phosphatase family protein [Pseudonocardia sp. CA-107938]|uniref:histidine phosphatase family protein n=1 Tax=Pseudonocardia sp. CA-107938 TaxID=3240021 RepID=UPI003D8B3AF8
MTLLLARHGQTVWHAENRYAGGASDPDLTDEGRAQADRLARWAVDRGVTAVVSSPQPRAVATAAPAAAALGVELAQCPELREVGFGIAEGHTLDELDPAVVAGFRADPVAHPFPGAEPPVDAAQRCVTALRAIATARPDDTVLVVAHNTLLRLGLCALLGLPVARYRQVFPRLDNVAITEIALGPDTAALLSFNVPLSAKEPT